MRDALNQMSDTPRSAAGAVTQRPSDSDLRTDRLILRPLDLEDADFLSRETSRSEVAHMLSRVPLPNPVLGVELFILSHRVRATTLGDRIWMITQADTGDRLGLISLHPAGEAGWELGYWLAPSAWGCGLATEAVGAVRDWARLAGRTPVVAGHFADNAASGRVLEKTGFAYTGETERAFSLGRMAYADVRRMALQ